MLEIEILKPFPAILVSGPDHQNAQNEAIYGVGYEVIDSVWRRV